MADPENIDVGLSLLDAGAMDAFVKEVGRTADLLETIKTTALAEDPVNPPTGGGASRPQAAQPIQSGYQQQVFGTPGQIRPPAPSFDPGAPTEADAYYAMARQPSSGLIVPRGYEDREPAVPTEEIPKQRNWTDSVSDFASRVVPAPIQRFAAPFLDDEGAFSKQNITQGLIYGAANAVVQPAQQAMATAEAQINPFAAQRQGISQGYAGGSTFGPMQLPFGGPNAGILGLSEAASAHFGALGQAIPSVWQPGISYGETLGVQAGLAQRGWRENSSDFNRLEDYASFIRTPEFDQGRLGELDTELQTGIMDKMFRYGATSEKEFEESMKGLADSAAGARMGLDEFVAGIDQTAEYLQTKGLTYEEGFNAAKDFSATTDQAPQVMNQLMDNPYWQATAMGKTQIPVQAQGLIAEHPGVFNDVTMDTIKMWEDTLGGNGVFQDRSVSIAPGVKTTITGKDQAQAMIAERLGFTPDQLQSFKANMKKSAIQGAIKDSAELYDKDASDITRRYKQGEIDIDQYNRLHNQLREGTGKYAGGQHASWNELREQITRGQSGISREQLGRLEGLSAGQRNKEIKKIIEKNAPPRTSEDKNKSIVSFTGLAEKMLKEVLPSAGGFSDVRRARRAANRGEESLSDYYLRSGGADISGLLESANAPQEQVDMAEAIEERGLPDEGGEDLQMGKGSGLGQADEVDAPSSDLLDDIGGLSKSLPGLDPFNYGQG